MPVIEGVGDEVFQVLLIAFVILLGIIGWWSTNISEQPVIRTFLILEQRHHTPPENISNAASTNPPQDTGQEEQTLDIRPEPVALPNTSSSASKDPVKDSSKQQSESLGEGSPGCSSDNHPAVQENSLDSNNESQELSSSLDTDESILSLSTRASELRRRRLQFFGGKRETDAETSACIEQHSGLVDETPDGAEASSSSNTDTCPADSGVGKESPQSEPCQACDDIRIKLKFLNDNQKLVQGKLQEPLGDFKRRNFAVEMSARKVIRLIFNGQVLQSDERTLQNYGLFDNCVVHCLVHNQRSTNSNVDSGSSSNVDEEVHPAGADTAEAREWDMSNVMYISMFVILVGIWYLRINFSQLFSATSTVALFGLSGIFVIFLVGMYIPDQEVLRT